jgi:hypothetical protein
MTESSSSIKLCDPQRHRSRLHNGALHRIVLHIEVLPGQTLSWRIDADSEIRVLDSGVWVTRHHSPYDYWPQPGDVLRVMRGERIWISNEGNQKAEVTVSRDLAPRDRQLRSRWLSSLWAIAEDLSTLLARR